MAETIVNGYIVNRVDYDVFDEIITFIADTGNVFTVLARGVKKILSKNAKALFYGSLVQIEFFPSRKVEGIGKLKKIHLLEKNSFELNNKKSLFILNSLVFISKLNGDNFFTFFRKTIDLIKSENDDNSLILFILISASKFLGLRINLESCSFCKSRKIKDFSFVDFGFVCSQHSYSGLNVNKNTIKLIYLANVKKFDAMRNFLNFDKLTACKIINGFIHEHSGISFLKKLII